MQIYLRIAKYLKYKIQDVSLVMSYSATIIHETDKIKYFYQ